MTRRDYTPRDVMEKLLNFSERLDTAIEEADDAAHKFAEADAAYRLAKAKAFVSAKESGATDKMAESMADLATEDTRPTAKLWEGLAKNRLEQIRAIRTQISAIQTGGNALKAELDMARYGPGVTP